MAAEYSSLRVPELKKLLAEKGLPQAGNKADLIARLQESDKKDAPQEEKPGECAHILANICASSHQ
jgi:SAP domain-containing ribonucleoprotein